MFYATRFKSNEKYETTSALEITLGLTENYEFLILFFGNTTGLWKVLHYQVHIFPEQKLFKFPGRVIINAKRKIDSFNKCNRQKKSIKSIKNVANTSSNKWRSFRL